MSFIAELFNRDEFKRLGNLTKKLGDNILFWNCLLVFIVIFSFRSFIRPGLVWKDDFIPRHSIYSYYSLFVWNPLEHGGALNDDLSNALLNSIRAFLSSIFGLELVSKVYVVGVVALCGVLMFKALVGFRDLFNQSRNYVVSFIGALIFTVNPWVTSRILSGHFFILSSYALTPIFLLYLVRYFDADGDKFGFIKCSFVFALVSMTSNHGFIMSLFLFFIVTLWYLVVFRKGVVILKSLFVVIISLLINSFWIFPTFNMIFNGVRDISFIQDISTALSINANWVNVVRLLGYFWSPYDKGIYVIGDFFQRIWLVLSFLSPLLVLISVIFNRKTRNFNLFLLFVYVVSFVLSQGTNLLGDYYLVFVQLPFMQLFRDPNKLLYLSAIASSLIIGTSLHVVLYQIKFVLNHGEYSIELNKLFAVFIIVSIFSVNFPWLSGDFNGFYSPSVRPEYSLESEDWLDEQSGDFRVLYLPLMNYLWFNWTHTGVNEPIRYLSPVPVFNPPFSAEYDVSPSSTVFLNYIANSLYDGSIDNVGQLLDLALVKYVVVRLDFYPPGIPSVYLEVLSRLDDLELVWNEGPIYIFENVLFSNDLIYSSSTPAVIFGGLDGLSNYISSGYESSGSALIFPEQVERSVILDNPLFIPVDSYYDFLFSYADDFEGVIQASRLVDGWEVDTWLQTLVGDINYDGYSLRVTDETHLWFTLDVNVTGDHHIWMKAFGTKPTLFIDGEESSRRLSDYAREGFRWFSLTENLSQGIHEIAISPEGFLAIDRLLVFSDDDYQGLLSEVSSVLESTPFLYNIELESYSSRYHPIEYNKLFSGDLGVVLLSDRIFKVDSPLIIPGNRSLVAEIHMDVKSSRGSSSRVFFTNIETNRVFLYYISPAFTGVGSYYLNDLRLDQGIYEVSFLGEDLAVDSVNVYPADTMNPFSSQNGETRLEFQEVYPTKYVVDGMNEPGVLVFSTSHTDAWWLDVNGQVVSPFVVNLFGMGFKVTEPGEAATLEFIPQRFMNLGYIVSAATVLSLLGFIIVRNRFGKDEET